MTTFRVEGDVGARRTREVAFIEAGSEREARAQARRMGFQRDFRLRESFARPDVHPTREHGPEAFIERSPPKVNPPSALSESTFGRKLPRRGVR